MNPSKRYNKEIAEREGKALADDIAKALERKNPTLEGLVEAIQQFGTQFGEMMKEIFSCTDCQISYSNGKIDGFCPEHEERGKRFQKIIEETLK